MNQAKTARFPLYISRPGELRTIFTTCFANASGVCDVSDWNIRLKCSLMDKYVTYLLLSLFSVKQTLLVCRLMCRLE